MSEQEKQEIRALLLRANFSLHVQNLRDCFECTEAARAKLAVFAVSIESEQKQESLKGCKVTDNNRQISLFAEVSA